MTKRSGRAPPTIRASPSCSRRKRSHLSRRQELGLPCRCRARNPPQREYRQHLGIDRRRRRDGTRVAVRLRAFLRRLQGQSRLRARCLKAALRRRRALARAVRHQWRHAARGCLSHRLRGERSCLGDMLGIHAHNDTEQASPCARRAQRRRAADPGHAERARRALRQRQSLLDPSDTDAEAVLCRSFRDRHYAGELGEAHPRLAPARRDPQPRAQPARGLCRPVGVRAQRRAPCLRRAEGSAHLRACAAGSGRQSAPHSGLRSGRPLQHHGASGRIGIEVPPRRQTHRPSARGREEPEFLGYAYDGAEASFELLARRALGQVPHYFDVESFRVMVERRHNAVGDLVTVSEADVGPKSAAKSSTMSASATAR